MEIAYVIYMILNVIIIGVVWWYANLRVFGRLAASAVNPLTIFALLAILFNLDFLVVWNSRDIDIMELIGSVSADDIVGAYASFTVMLAAMSIGLLLAAETASKPNRLTEVVPSRAETRASELVFVTVAAVSLPLLLSAALSEEGNLSAQVLARENQVVTLIGLFLPFALAIYVSKAANPFAPRVLLPVGCITGLQLMSGGSRVLALIYMLNFVVAYSLKRRVSALWILVAAPPLALLLAIMRYAFRELPNEPGLTFAGFLDKYGGLLNLYFASEEIGFAKMFSMVYSKSNEFIIFPFQSVLSFFIVLAPRAVFPDKPLGASAQFTSLYSPVRWQLTKSETTITGFGDLFVQFGLLGSALFSGALGFMWLSLCIRALRTSDRATILWLPLLLWCMYLFFRADLFNIGYVLWPSLLVFAAYRAVLTLTQLLAGQRSSGKATLGTQR